MSASRPSFRDRHLFTLVHLKGLLRGFARRHFGQWAEDAILAGIFEKKPTGFYVDVGAYHPFHYSNTYLLYKKGWRGINIDPNPQSIRLFNWHRRRDINVNYGIADEVSDKTYYLFNHQSCNTFSQSQKELMMKKSFIKLLGETTIPCAPLSKILEKEAPGTHIDFLNVDVEGMGLSVLRSLDWNRTQPSVICVEDDAFDFSKEGFGSEIFSLLRSKGYVFHSKVGPSVIYTKAL